MLLCCFTSAVTVDIPGDNVISRDVNVPRSTVKGDQDSIIQFIQLINGYLWFSIAAIGVIVALYAGYQIIMSQGDKAKMKKGNETLTSALIGILIAVFSYVLVRLVVNIF
ncbi:MAG TPA: hypothetical protein PLW93_05605 [Candidatus Absconditabacterales bacterium]|nr:hypothetical protein [Candidatus Absconditabacterales bacterium]HNG97721.1 hypothetical protein [Candidatus Absconditabacterales bacterium]